MSDMAQARLGGFLPRTDRLGRVQTPETYIGSLRGLERGRRQEIALLATRPDFATKMRRSLEVARERRRSRSAELQEEREAEVLRILRALGGRCFARDLYGRLVQASAERGWPIVSWRRFSQVLAELGRGRCHACGGTDPGGGAVRLEVRSFGRYGRRTVVQIRTSGGTAEGSAGVGRGDESYDSVSRTTERRQS